MDDKEAIFIQTWKGLDEKYGDTQLQDSEN
jgi:hypothetical protein